MTNFSTTDVSLSPSEYVRAITPQGEVDGSGGYDGVGVSANCGTGDRGGAVFSDVGFLRNH